MPQSCMRKANAFIDLEFSLFFVQFIVEAARNVAFLGKAVKRVTTSDG